MSRAISLEKYIYVAYFPFGSQFENIKTQTKGRLWGQSINS